jgi:hypothetical protein
MKKHRVERAKKIKAECRARMKESTKETQKMQKDAGY